MTITLPLQPHEEALLIAAARAKGVSTDELLREALNSILADSTLPPENPRVDGRSIWDVLLENGSRVPAEEFAKLPPDGASEHDHYLYGAPKRHE